MEVGFDSSKALGWGTLALINAAIANTSGRSALKFFLGSLLGGPIMTIVLAVTHRDDQGRLRQSNLLGEKGAIPIDGHPSTAGESK